MDIAYPDTLEEAFTQDKLQERAITMTHKKNKFALKVPERQYQPYNSRTIIGAIPYNPVQFAKPKH